MIKTIENYSFFDKRSCSIKMDLAASNGNYAKLIETAKLPQVVAQFKSTDFACSMDFFVQRAVYWSKRLFGKERAKHPWMPTPSEDVDDDDENIKLSNICQQRRKRCHDCSNAYANSGLLPSIVPQSLPWMDSDIRLVDSTPKGILSHYSWTQIENEIRLGHMKFLKDLKSQGKSVVPYMIKSFSYCKYKMCGVIEVACKGDASKIRNELIPLLELSVKIKAMLNSDQPVPVVTTVASPDYDVYSIDDFVEMLKMVNPVIEKEQFQVVETVLKDSGGRQLFIRTSTKVVNYIREKGYVLELAVGETVFDKRIEFVGGQHVYSKDKQ
jgi:hypothetical protein